MRIYTHYFKSFIGTRAIIITQPQITGVSKKVRKEALPVFYGCCNFAIHTMEIANSPGSPFYPQQTNRLLELATPNQFGRIQHITVRLDFEGCEVELKIDVSNKRTPVKVFHLLKYPYPTHLPAAQSDYMSSELGTLVSGIVARQGVSKLQEGDLKQVHQIVRSILMQRGG